MALRFLNSGYFAGKVGIGTDNPEGNLEISDSTQATGATLSITNAHIGSWVTGDKIGSIDFRIDDTSTTEPVRAKIHAEGKTTGTYPFSSQLVFSTTNANTLSESMRITSTGNVGIGTVSPAAGLQAGIRWNRLIPATAGASTASCLKYLLAIVTAGVTEMGIILWSCNQVLTASGVGTVAKVSTIAGDGTDCLNWLR